MPIYLPVAAKSAAGDPAALGTAPRAAASATASAMAAAAGGGKSSSSASTSSKSSSDSSGKQAKIQAHSTALFKL